MMTDPEQEERLGAYAMDEIRQTMALVKYYGNRAPTLGKVTLDKVSIQWPDGSEEILPEKYFTRDEERRSYHRCFWIHPMIRDWHEPSLQESLDHVRSDSIVGRSRKSVCKVRKRLNERSLIKRLMAEKSKA